MAIAPDWRHMGQKSDLRPWSGELALVKDCLLTSLPPELHSKEIAIIGAGLAGMSVAYTLGKTCISSSVFEAADRLGGRAFTDSINGQQIERGGELISTNHVSIQKLARELDLTIENLYPLKQERIQLGFMINDKRYDHQQFAQALGPLQQLMQADIDRYGGMKQAQFAMRKISLEEYVDSTEVESWAKEALKLVFSTEYGRACSDIGADSLFYEEIHNLDNNNGDLFAKGYSQFRIKEGSGALAYEMSGSLAPVNCAHKLTKIAFSEEKYTLSFDVDGKTVTKQFDVVVLAVPFTALRGVDFSECALSDVRREAIECLQYGSTIKTFISAQSQGDSRNQTEVLNNRLSGAVWNSSRNTSNPSDLMTLYSNDTTLQLDNAEIASIIKRDHGGKRAKVLERSSWKNNPLAGGSYSIDNIDFPIEGRKTTEKHGSLYFAGEHTLVHASYMNSAVRSGFAVANRIIRYLFSLSSESAKSNGQKEAVTS